MNVIFFFHTEQEAFELKVNWSLPFIPEVGDIVDILLFLNGSDIELAQRIKSDSEDKNNSDLMKILRNGGFDFEVESRIWVSGGVKLLLTERYFDEIPFRFTFSDWSRDDLQLSFPTSYLNPYLIKYDERIKLTK